MMTQRQHPGERNSLFDRVVDRRGSDSVKWRVFESDVLPMWVADMDFPSPQPVIDALEARIRHGVFGYAGAPPELREVVVERLKRCYDWTVTREDLVFLPNVVVSFNLACHAAAAAGDELLHQPPIYFPILWIPENTGMVANPAPLVPDGNGRYEIDFDAFESAITDGTRVFILCNPHNPVSRVFTTQELAELAEICLKHEITICSDEIHADFVFDGRRHVPVASLDPEIAQQTITILAPNKTFNVAGVSSAVAIVPNPELRKRLQAAHKGLVPHVGALNYAAMLAAFRDGDPWLAELIDYLQGNRDLLASFVAEELPGIRLTPIEGTYLAWLDCRKAIEANPHEFFLREARVALNDGASFGPGGEGFVRLNFGCPRSLLSEGLERIRRALASRESS